MRSPKLKENRQYKSTHISSAIPLMYKYAICNSLTQINIYRITDR